MKVALRPATVEWIKAKVFPYMEFKDVCVVGALLNKIVKGAYCVYIDEEFLDTIVKICIGNDMTDSAVFYYLCGKAISIQSRKAMNAKKDQFCIRFPNTPEQKIRSIKAMRDLVKDSAFINLVGTSYSYGLKEMKEAVEDGIVLGPFTKDQVNNIKVLMLGAFHEVEPYVGQKTLKDVQF